MYYIKESGRYHRIFGDKVNLIMLEPIFIDDLVRFEKTRMIELQLTIDTP
ncbi:hypothetical protein JMUB7465_04090 [Staphylococcus aureus]|nr:hypothetical protein [Staphylococcus aureus]HDT6673468.1 hypothetical protein [Staphylococcus aureus M0274]EJX2088780.1 hypothetical protein [Staphylococcus aureus]ELK7116883.1 hypothetical protein [Staphylococcus aureus]MBU5020534.1 hypothetical protein [Staphylococcus aureus]MBU6850824.1 hypothetical protein [Staphylococcus aureus]